MNAAPRRSPDGDQDAGRRPGSWNDLVIEQFRAGERRIADQFDRDSLLLLHTTGARTGQSRVSPVMYLPADGRYVVVASAAGRERNPSWYVNLLADPRVTAEVWSDDVIDEFEATATTVEGAERDELWAAVTATAPGFAEYQRRTSRVIPVVALERETS